MSRDLTANKRCLVDSHLAGPIRREARSWVATARSQYSLAAVAICNPDYEICFVSQLSNSHCSSVEVLAPGISFYVVSCYCQHRDEIEEHLRHLEKVFIALRGKRLLVSLHAKARSSLWGSQSSDERGVLLEELIQAFGLYVVNDAAQPPTYWTTKGSSYIDVTLASPEMFRFVGNWRVRTDWTSSDHNAVEIRLRAPKAAAGERRAGNTRFDTRRADWELYVKTLAEYSRQQLEPLELESAGDAHGSNSDWCHIRRLLGVNATKENI